MSITENDVLSISKKVGKLPTTKAAQSNLADNKEELYYLAKAFKDTRKNNRSFNDEVVYFAYKNAKIK